MRDYDVIVLGGGSAGSSAAQAASRAGARTAMINDGELGGLCILRGCMPTKALLATAHAVHEAEHLEPLGARLDGSVTVDFRRLMQRKDTLVRRFQKAKIESIESADYEVIPGRGRFEAGGGVRVGSRLLRAKRYVLATGSIPAMLPLPGIEDVPVLTSDDVMRLDAPPESLIVQGAGAIGLELSQFFSRIGTRVLLVNRSGLLSKLDADCGAELTRALEDEPRFELAVPGAIESLRRDGSGLVATIREGERLREHRADALLMAAGRRAALDGLGLAAAGIVVESNRVKHDAAMRTSNPDVFVAGDVTGLHQILHLSNQEGSVAGHNAADSGAPREMDYRRLMQVTFTDPPYAQVGP